MEKHGLWIAPALVQDDAITWQEKSVLALIANLSQNGGCFASNRYIGAYFGVSANRISKILSALYKKGYVTSSKKPNNYGAFTKRCLELANTDYIPKGKESVGEKSTHNKYNNKNINKNLYSRKTQFNNYSTDGELSEFEKLMLKKRVERTGAEI